MWIRRALAVVVAWGLFWSVADSALLADMDRALKVQRLERLVAAEPGVADVSVPSGPPNLTLARMEWAVMVTFAEGTSVERRGELVPRIFELAKQVGMPEDFFGGATFKGPGGWLHVDKVVDVSMSEVFAMLDWNASSVGFGLQVDVDEELGKWRVGLYALLGADSTAEFVEQAAQFAAGIPRPPKFRVTIDVTGYRAGPYMPSGFLAMRPLSAADLVFLDAVQSWAGRNPDISLSIAMVPGRGSASLFTGDVRPAVVREFAAIVRDHGQSLTVFGFAKYVAPYLTIPPP